MSVSDPFALALQLSEQTGYQYEKVDDRVWKFLFTGKYLAEIDVLAIHQPPLFILGALIVPRQQLKDEPKLADTLLLLNNNLDRVKIGFNQDDVLFVRIDLSVRIVDVQELKDNIDQVSAAADYVYGAIQPYLIEQAEESREEPAPEEGEKTEGE